MQGFNRYFPPDFDPEKHVTLNTYHGKHALGDRARKIDKGILITRFELPFNIWCGTCENHIGMGVRYNAEKKKIGNYFSTPIYSFRCKCHLCSGWFEIQTDPKNTRYVVVSGARKQEQDWDPEENGGFPVQDSNAASTSADALASLEKTTTAEQNLNTVVKPRLSQLTDLSERRNADPYTLSRTLRRSFRDVKKAEKKVREEEESVKDKFSLDPSLKLVPKEDASLQEEAREEWEKARREYRLQADLEQKTFETEHGRLSFKRPRSVSTSSAVGSGSKRPSSASRPRTSLPHPKLSSSLSSSLSSPKASSSSSVKATLASTLLRNSLKRTDPFALPSSSKSARLPGMTTARPP